MKIRDAGLVKILDGFLIGFFVEVDFGFECCVLKIRFL
jgi:hypothetical protein